MTTDRPTVMISSTAIDLPEHREQVRLACERAGAAPHAMMENLTAEDADAVEVSLRMVEEADIYICILAHRYGWVPPGEDISITEMEYDKAVELGRPRLVFFMDDEHPVSPKHVEKGAGAEKLDRLKARIGQERVAAFFTTPEDLRGHVVEALANLLPTLGEDKTSTQRAQESLHRRSAIPPAPAEYVAHPYTLLQAQDLVGRQSELRLLTDWVSEPRSAAYRARIFNLIAIGGMGKSALTWKWFREIAPQEAPDLKGRMWWSFYESDATFWNFVLHALAYVSGDDVADLKKLPRKDVEGRLFRHLDEEPHLIALDGLERAMIAYARVDASRLADDELDKETANWIAGSAGLSATQAATFVRQHRLRQMMDPRDGAFLRRLTQARASRVLITSRLYPSELQMATGRPAAGCFAVLLGGLTEDDGLALWRELGVIGKRAELGPIFKSVEGHPLLIHALAKEVAGHRAASGDFGAWRAAHPQFDIATLNVAEARTHILDFALRGLDGAAREALEHIVTFNMPASYDSLAAVLVGERKACADAGALDRALTELEDRGLVGWDRAANRYDAHPIVRGVVWGLIGAEDRGARLRALEAHFEPMETPETWTDVESLADLAPAIERYHMLLGLKRFDDAIDLFYDRMGDATLWRLAAHRERIGWLTPLFPDGVERAPALTTARDQSYAMNALALSLKNSGRPGTAAPLYRSMAALDEAGLIVGLGNLGDCLTEIGAFREAEVALRRQLELARTREDALREADALRDLGRVQGFCGAGDWTAAVLAAADRLYGKQNHDQGRGTAAAYQAEALLAAGATRATAARAATAAELACVHRLARDLTQAALLQGQAALALGDAQAADWLNEALSRARAANMTEFELPALTALARLSLMEGDPATARTGLEGVWAPAAEGPYPRHLADALSLSAEIEIAAGDEAAAIKAATAAYRAAWCDGPPYAYHWGLEAAKAHLKALGAPEPEMPPFDESKFDPMPDIEILPD